MIAVVCATEVVWARTEVGEAIGRTEVGVMIGLTVVPLVKTVVSAPPGNKHTLTTHQIDPKIILRIKLTHFPRVDGILSK